MIKRLLGLMLLPLLCLGSVSFVGSADLGNNGGTGTLNVSYTVGSGLNRLLIVGVFGDQATDALTGVTYNGVAMTQYQKTHVDASTRWLYGYYLLNPASGAHTVSITTTTGWILAGAADYSGVKQVIPDASVGNSQFFGASGTQTTSLTTVADNCWTILIGGAATTVTAGTGSTLRHTFYTGGAGMFDSNAPIHPAGSTSMAYGFTGNGNDGMEAVMVSFAPAPVSTARPQGIFF